MCGDGADPRGSTLTYAPEVQPNMMKLTLNLTGDGPMMQHNGDLADPLNPYSKKMKEISGKRKKTDDDHLALADIEFRGSLYETPEGLIGLPTLSLVACIYTAATNWKLGAAAKRAIRFDDTTEPLLIDGKHVAADEYLAEFGLAVRDRRPVVVQKSRVIRTRPLIPNWSTTFHIEVDPGEFSVTEDMEQVLTRAGQIVGVGEMRPTYGRFTVECPELDFTTEAR